MQPYLLVDDIQVKDFFLWVPLQIRFMRLQQRPPLDFMTSLDTSPSSTVLSVKSLLLFVLSFARNERRV